MLIKDQHFAIEETAGLIRCVPLTPEATSAYKTLQLLLMKLVEQVPSAPRGMVTLDGTVGPTTALVVQVIAARLAEGSYSELSELATAQPEEVIPYIGHNAMEIAGVFDMIVAKDPTALVAPRTLAAAAEPVDPVQMLKGLLTGPRIAAASAALLGVTGLAVAAYVSDRRGSGVADRSSMLPESDGTDDFDEDADEGDDGQEDGSEGQGQESGDDGQDSSGESAHAA